MTDEEVAQEIDRMAQSDPRQAARIRARYQSAERRQALRESLLERKALDWVIEAATIHDEVAAECAAGRSRGALMTSRERSRTVMGLVPIVVEQTGRGERAYDIYLAAAQGPHHLHRDADRRHDREPGRSPR